MVGGTVGANAQTISDGRGLSYKPVSITTPLEDSGSCHPTVTVSGKHNMFPDYEAVVDGPLVYNCASIYTLADFGDL